MSDAGERLSHPIRALPGDALAAGTLRLRVYDTPVAELEKTVGDRVARWVQRLYESYGVDLSDPPLSASMEAVAEGLMHRLEGMALILRKAEARGWQTSVENYTLVVVTGLPDQQVRDMLEEDGVLTLVQEFS
ncbi:MAG: hypothetical protein ABR573_12040 [Candidatus Dormibacteria bacterium]